MLCSHKKKFIYLKTLKTAGTSVEIFFEKYCHPLETYSENHATNELITEDGIIGYRGSKPDLERFYNHMPAAKVRELLGESIWNSYYKFCVIRNPFDKVVSMFWMSLSEADRLNLKYGPFQIVQQKFYEYTLNSSKFPLDRHIFLIDGELAVDHFIRFEFLNDDVKEVCRMLDIPPSVERLGFYKNNLRLRKEHFSGYYDAYSEKMVRDVFNWEINYFKYEL
jgi:hypothetical protein